MSLSQSAIIAVIHVSGLLVIFSPTAMNRSMRRKNPWVAAGEKAADSLQQAYEALACNHV
jgi:hypothetical protein